jgi:hypothetical protein
VHPSTITSFVADLRPAPGGKRRLPVLQTTPAEEDPPRPAWQWGVFGALAIVTTWVPATAIAGAILGHWNATPQAPLDGDAIEGVLRLELVVAGTYALALATGAVAGGYVVGRWGSPGIGVREAALGGLAAAGAAAAAAWQALGPTAGVVVVPLLVVPAAAAGARLGLRRRARAG